MAYDIKQIIARYMDAMFAVDKRLHVLIAGLLPDELTIDQYFTLSKIRNRQRCTSSELAEYFCVGKSSITAIVNRLFDKQWLARVTDDKDRRVIYLSVTEEGERLAIEIDAKVEELLKKYLVHFTDEEAMRFIETFEKLGRVLLEP